MEEASLADEMNITSSVKQVSSILNYSADSSGPVVHFQGRCLSPPFSSEHLFSPLEGKSFAMRSLFMQTRGQETLGFPLQTS